jgi:hypothetical protein
MTRPIATTGSPSRPASGANTRANYNHLRKMATSPTPIKTSVPTISQSSALIPFPSRSILAADQPLEPINLAQARFNEALMFALLLNFSTWGLFALAVWALFFKVR